jgi:hypothetical protein
VIGSCILGSLGRMIGQPDSPPIESNVKNGVTFWEGTRTGTYGSSAVVSSGTFTVNVYCDDAVIADASGTISLSSRINAAFLPCRGKEAVVELVNYTGDSVEIIGITLDAEILDHR